MNSLAAIVFVMFATILGKWLLFDDDRTESQLDESQDLKIADSPPDPPVHVGPPPYSKSA